MEVIIIVEIKAKKVVKLLKKNGFVEIGIKGDHHKFANDKGVITVVPYANLGDTIATGTLSAISRQTNIKFK